ncbi:MAG: NAD(P)/FAD-dependent oxidoreductase [Candidatus Aminicenantales bacterium]
MNDSDGGRGPGLCPGGKFGRESSFFDVIVIGAGASGMMSAIEAGKRGRSVLVLDHNPRIGEKIRVSGGGRCNFTNIDLSAGQYLSQNPNFCKSALSRFTPADFLGLLAEHRVKVEERAHGQMFCAGSAQSVVDALERESRAAGVRIRTSSPILEVRRDGAFRVGLSCGTVTASSLVVASGGLSYRKLGATNFAQALAGIFGIGVTDLRPGLVPLVLAADGTEAFRELSGVSLDVLVRCGRAEFRENMLFTHRGLSGPAILQASSYWKEDQTIEIDLLPGADTRALLLGERRTRRTLIAVLADRLPRRFVEAWLDTRGGANPPAFFSTSRLERLAEELHHWRLRPDGTEGYDKAEVTVGGIDTRGLSSQTMESRKIAGLYFVGECVDVTGQLGGFNLQWAWSSGWTAGQYA